MERPVDRLFRSPRQEHRQPYRRPFELPFMEKLRAGQGAGGHGCGQGAPPGIGRALVQDFEEQVRMRGALTVMLGTDDEDNRTSLSNTDLYVEPWKKISEIKNFGRHPFEFYQKMGYCITGVVPDANGAGKPDILMSKKIPTKQDQ